jgi:hypothetical protein
MGAMRKNGKKKAKQRAHAEHRRVQEKATVSAAERNSNGGMQRPSMGRSG